MLVGILSLLALLLASQAAYALARNLRLSDILFSRSPGPGPWIESLTFALGCALPRRLVPGRKRPGVGRASGVGGLGGLGGLVSAISAWAAASTGTQPSTTAIAARWAMTVTGFAPRDSPKAIRPQPSATSAASAFISEIELIALSCWRADWKAKKPPKVASAATGVHTREQRGAAVGVPAERDRFDRGVSDTVEGAGGEGPQRGGTHRGDDQCRQAGDGYADGE